MRGLFQTLVFCSAFLAICLELAGAKLLLPRFGGSAYVWTGSMLFFQGMLLLGYLYSRRARYFPRVHVALLTLPIYFLPLSLPAARPEAGPFIALFRALLFSVGAPFFALSTTVVVAQSWLMRSSLDDRNDGYFLYAASNAGALAALIAYPFAIEPFLSLHAQGLLWRTVYAAYVGLCTSIIFCRRPAPTEQAPGGPEATARERALWLLLSAAPCAALLAATNLMSLDFAAVPLLWTAPLATYLITYVLNFKRNPWRLNRLSWTTLAILLFGIALCLAPMGRFAYALFALFVFGMIFHKSLAVSRPFSERAMTQYYSWIAVGGFLGTALVGVAVPWLGRNIGAAALDWAAVGLLAFCAMAVRDWDQLSRKPKLSAGLAVLFIATAIFLIAAGARTGKIYSLRNFYGLYSVEDSDGFRWFYHGNTDHGMQFLDQKRQTEPLSYYGHTSPLGEAMSALSANWSSVCVVGLGVGSLAAYGRAGMTMDFYELDPDVIAIAGRWFTHLRLSSATIRVVTGDARLSLERADGAAYDAIILDAFNSGSIPVHLLTKEAFGIYLSRLKPAGTILIHVSNRYLDLRPILATTARDLGLFGASKRQVLIGPLERGRAPSVWVALSRDAGMSRAMVDKKGWAELKTSESGPKPWTDQHASLLSALAR